MPTHSRWSIPIPNVTVSTFLFTSSTHPLPNKPIFLDAADPERLNLTFTSLRLWSQRFAAGLQAHGFQDGDRLLLFSGNTLFFPVVVHGVNMAGGIFSGANPSYTANELAHQLKNTGAKFLICGDVSLEIGLEAAKKINLPKESVFVFDEGDATFDGIGKGRLGCAHWTELVADEKTGKAFVWKEDEHLHTRTVALNYSSGTTGLSKGVEISHRNYIANALQHMHFYKIHPSSPTTKHTWRWFCFLPMYHALAQTVFCVGALHLGVPVYIMRRFDFQGMLEGVQNFRITHLSLVPPVVVRMAKSSETRRYDLSSVFQANSGAAPLGRPISEEFEMLWPPGRVNLMQAYGMTEVTCCATGWDPTHVSTDASVGEVAPNVEIMLIDASGTEVEKAGPDNVGEMWIRGPNIMKGYWQNPKATQETINADGWMKTGDIAYKDENQRFMVVDRLKELIKVKGLQVAPAELESQLLEHPAISDACVVGVSIDGDERPRAYVVLSSNIRLGNPSPEDVANFIAERLSKHKHLTGGVKIVDEIRKNPSGKLLRRYYRELAKEELNIELGCEPKAKL